MDQQTVDAKQVMAAIQADPSRLEGLLVSNPHILGVLANALWSLNEYRAENLQKACEALPEVPAPAPIDKPSGGVSKLSERYEEAFVRDCGAFEIPEDIRKWMFRWIRKKPGVSDGGLGLKLDKLADRINDHLVKHLELPPTWSASRVSAVKTGHRRFLCSSFVLICDAVGRDPRLVFLEGCLAVSNAEAKEAFRNPLNDVSSLLYAAISIIKSNQNKRAASPGPR
jgi:hypothetical protein